MNLIQLGIAAAKLAWENRKTIVKLFSPNEPQGQPIPYKNTELIRKQIDSATSFKVGRSVVPDPATQTEKKDG